MLEKRGDITDETPEDLSSPESQKSASECCGGRCKNEKKNHPMNRVVEAIKKSVPIESDGPAEY
jgi:hypothetical protein